ncbi:MAG TPA: metallophosphoesterase family protein [Roseiflexaceae bacterium]|nr:metallophosphoesterase family protein [Roseiflexaceae bacterium]
MRLALFSDVHGNWTALQEVWAAIQHCGSFDTIVCAGDLAGGRPHPSECVEFLAAHDVICILGNTDTFFLGHPVPDSDARRRLPYLDAQIVWCSEHLSPAAHRFLQHLPMTYHVTPEPEATALICHATPSDLWPICPPDAPDSVWQATMGPTDAAVIAFGHVHAPAIRRIDATLYVNVAHCGLGAAEHVGFTILTYTNSGWQAERHRVAHDSTAEQTYARRVGFPGADQDRGW